LQGQHEISYMFDDYEISIYTMYHINN